MRRLLLVAGLLIAGGAHANEANRIWLGMSDAQRADTMTKFMARSGERCTVTKTFYQGSTPNGDAIWSIACKGGPDWSLVIYNDRNGSTKIMECRALKALGAGQCWKRY